MDTPYLRLERTAGIAKLILNQPAKRNAINAAMWQALPAAVDRLEADPEVKLVIVRGADDRAFSAGADISEFPEVYATPERAEAYNEAVRVAQLALAELSKPTLATIRGACVGGGCGIALCCDLRIASRDARFGITPARLGLAYSFEDTRRLVNAVGPAHAKDILFTGQLIDAERAYQIGLINRLVEGTRLDDEAAAYAAQICAGSQYSVRAAKSVIDRIAAGADEADAELRAQLSGAFIGEDFREGYKSFIERRPARFRWGISHEQR